MRKMGFCLIVALVALSLSVSAYSKEKVRSPLQHLAVTTYNIGGTSHASCAAHLEGIFKKTRTRMRVIPGGNDAARIWPLRTGDAGFMYVTSSACGAAALGKGELYTRPEWGPQKMRAVYYSHPERCGFLVMPKNDISTTSDLKGKRVSMARGNAAWDMFVDALLLYANLTRDDVELVYFSSMEDSYLAPTRGKADIAWADFLTPSTQQISISSGFRVVPMPNVTKEDKKAWARVHEVYPHFFPQTMDGSHGAIGATPQKPYYGYGYADAFWTLASQDDDIAYAFCEALYDSYDERAKVYSLCAESTLEAQTKKDWTAWMPWHPGAIKFLKDKGVWTSEWDKRQAKKLADEEERLKKYKATR